MCRTYHTCVLSLSSLTASPRYLFDRKSSHACMGQIPLRYACRRPACRPGFLPGFRIACPGLRPARDFFWGRKQVADRFELSRYVEIVRCRGSSKLVADRFTAWFSTSFRPACDTHTTRTRRSVSRSATWIRYRIWLIVWMVTRQLADATGDFACLVFVLSAASATPRVVQLPSK